MQTNSPGAASGRCSMVRALFAMLLAVLGIGPAWAGPTTTTLASSVNPAVVGQNFTLTATVAGTSPTGTVTFKRGSTTLATVALAGNVATHTMNYTSTGMRTITATYNGDANDSASTSNTVSQGINKSPTTLTVSVGTNPIASGVPATFTATITGYAPAGDITFYDNTTVLGTAPLVGNVATLSGVLLAVGTHPIIDANFYGDANNLETESPPVSFTVTASGTSTTTALGSSVNPSATGQNTTLSATVTPSAATGSVTFKDGATTLGSGTLSGGVATLSTSFAASGSHSLTAVYAGNASYTTSTSVPLSQTVNAAGSTSTALTSNINPAVVGQNFTLTATVAGTDPSGTVTFKRGSTTLATVALAGNVATHTMNYTSTGTRTITATYNGDANDSASTSNTVSQGINKSPTTLTVSVGTNPIASGVPATFTATITGYAPAGDITFYDNTTVLGTAPLVGNVATLSGVLLAVGTHPIIDANFYGDANNLEVESPPVSFTVTASGTSTTTALGSSVNPSATGQNTTLSATVTPSAATGSVTFKDGATTLGSGTLSSGVATLATSFAASGAHSLTAVYAGNASYTTSTSVPLSQTVNAAGSTSTALTSNTNPSIVGQNFTLTATVNGTSPTGTVTFKNGATTLATVNLAGSSATYTTNFTSPGTRSLTATYNGDANDSASTSNTLSQGINKSPTTLTVSVGTNPIAYGVPATFTATITGYAPAGDITFYDNYTVLGTAPLVGNVATLSGVLLAVGTHPIIDANFYGDANNLEVESPPVSFTVSPAGTTSTALSATPNPANLGQTVTLSATVTGSSPTGTVTFKDGTTTIGTGTLSAGVASLATTFSATGSHSLSAVYGGNGSNNPSTSSAVSLAVNSGATTTALASSINPSSVGQNTTLTATVTPSSATGSVTFKDGATTLGSGTLSAGVATLSTSFSATGTHSLSAVYAGDTTYTTSTSASLNQSVNALATTTTALASTINPTTVGQNTTLSATVTPSTSTGTVTFKEGTTTLGTGTLSGGTATLVTSFASAGNHILTAAYGGDSSNAASTSAAGTQVVNGASTSTSLTATPNPATDGGAVVLTATINGGVSPSGSVSFQDGAVVLGTANLTSGQASLTTSLTGTGAHSLTAAYAGDASNNPSTSSVSSVQVNGAPALPPPASSALPVIDYEYDAQGNRTKVIQDKTVSGFNFATVNTYDPLNRAKDSTDARLGVTRFGYDALDRVLQVTDPRNLVTQSPRNGLGNTTQLVSPDTGTTSFNSYDAAGNLLTRTDSRGVLATMSYDALNRPSSVVYSQSGHTPQSFVWSYDQTGAGFANGVGRLTSTSHPSGTTQYSYDPQGRVIDDIQRVNAAAGANPSQIISTVTYGYDSAGHVTSIVYPSGRKLSVTFTDGVPASMGLAKDAGSAASPLITSIQWEPFGAARSWVWQLASGTQVHAREFDTAGRLVRYRLGGYVRDITYDAADRISGYSHLDVATASATAAASALNQGFGYDELGRLTGITTSTASWSIGYDANGNRTGVTLNGTPSTYTTASMSNRLNSITNPARSFGYDVVGNTTSDTGSGYTATYDLSGRMATLTKAGVTTTYSYNGQGQRVRKFSSTGASSTVIFVYDQAGQLLSELDSSGAPLREYVWLGSTPIAVFMPDPANAANPPLVFYVHADHIDSPRVVTDKNNNLRWRWLAEPFGTTAAETNPSGLGAFTFNLRFPGQYADSESGLSYNYFRDYDSSTGRYAQSDPIGLAGGINTYAYVGGNPVSFVDPNGLDRWGGATGGPGLIVAGGGSLNLYSSSGNSVLGSYGYTSGRGGITDPSVRNFGPTPPGSYTLNPSEISEGGFLRNLLGDWGNYRVPLHPDGSTNTFGRDGFFLHGGRRPGSAGCIDVGQSDTALFQQLLRAGRPIPVFVGP